MKLTKAQKRAIQVIKRKTAEMVWTALTGQIAYNQWLDKLITGKTNREKMQVVRGAHLNYIKTATIAAVFIDKKGLTKEFDQFRSSVDHEIALIAAEKGAEG